MFAQIIINPLLLFAVALIVLELKEHGSTYGRRQIIFNILMVLAIGFAMTNIPDSIISVQKLTNARMFAIAISVLLCFSDIFHTTKESVLINAMEIIILSVALGFQSSLVLF